MVTVKVNTISKASGNNVAMQVPLNLKSYTTTQRNALTSAAGDMIYNTTTSKVEYYNGSSWESGLSEITVEYLIVAGGGSGGRGEGVSAGGAESGGQLQTRFRSPKALSTRATGLQNLRACISFVG